MAAWDRETPWRQGHVLSGEAAKAFGFDTDAADELIVVVVSHDCDLAQPPAQEPLVEVIVGHRIEKADGNYTFGKVARRLHLSCSGGTASLTVELLATDKKFIRKDQLGEYGPITSVLPTEREREILQRWLAARYRRSAFPDEFDRRFEETGLRDRLAKIMKRLGTTMLAVYFDLDQGTEVTRNGADDVYELGIYLLYSTENDAEDSEQAATAAAKAIEVAFGEKCRSKKTGAWHDIELIECLAIADEAMTIRQAEHLKKWTMDYMSLRAEPVQAILKNDQS